jgi:glucose/arabinose dehydrogenase
VSSLLSTGGSEQGLLGLAFHPGYAGNGRFFVYYTDTNGDLQISEFHVSLDPAVADDTSESSIINIPHPFHDNHNGGNLVFGPDGMLYAGTGDGGGGGDTEDNARHLSSLLGKLLRFDVDIAAPHIPADNPFVATPGAHGEIWALGLRNPWRYAFDRQTGDLLIGDVGQNTIEEVDFQPAGVGGLNYCWPNKEGTADYDPGRPCTGGTPTDPIAEYDHGLGCSITGGYRYRGAFADLVGVYLYADYCSGRIWGASPDGGPMWATRELLNTSHNISTFGEDADGTLYLADHGGGTIYRIVTTLFADVPPGYWARAYIEALYRDGVTGGCTTNPRNYCPDASVTREQMAVFLLKSSDGPQYAPPPCTTAPFADVSCSSPFAAWIQELVARGITAGCGGTRYCPTSPVTREQMAVFMLRALGVTAAGCMSAPFADVPCSSLFAPWIQELVARGITAGCSATTYCPRNAVTRAQMAVFLVKAFGLPL